MQVTGRSQGLPPPQALYPPDIPGTAFTAPTNKVGLGAGQAILVPAGAWLCSGGAVSAIQYRDPVSREWAPLSVLGQPWAAQLVADGFNYRIANLSGVATGATVTTAGANYLQETTMVLVSPGNSRWLAVIGGALGTITVTAPGSNYTVPPDVFIARPPTPGVCATATATLGTGGTVVAITVGQRGAGYRTPPGILLIPSPTDPNVEVSRIENAMATATLTGTGAVTAVLLTNFGTAQAAAPTLSIQGDGTGAAATVLPATWVAAADDVITIQPAGVF